jgi:hypothetical protein
MGLVYILLVPQIWMATSQNGWCAISSTPRSPFGSNSTKRQLEQCFGSNSGTASNRGKEIQLRILSKYSQNKEIHMGPTSFRAHFPKFTGRPETGARLERIAFWIGRTTWCASPHTAPDLDGRWKETQWPNEWVVWRGITNWRFAVCHLALKGNALFTMNLRCFTPHPKDVQM